MIAFPPLLRCIIFSRRMTATGQKPPTPCRATCLLSPASDIEPVSPLLFCKKTRMLGAELQFVFIDQISLFTLAQLSATLCSFLQSTR
jgi:hypothetical protein